jgi:hypothetical protein
VRSVPGKLSHLRISNQATDVGNKPFPTIAQRRNGGPGWLEVECNHCKTRASLPLDGICRRQAEERLDILYSLAARRARSR